MTNTRVPPRQPRRVGRDTVSSSPPPPPLELPPNSLLRKSINVTGEDEEGARGRLLRLLRRGAHGSKSGHFLLKTESNSGKRGKGRGREKTYETYVVRLREQGTGGGGGGETRAAYANRHGIPLPFLYLRAILPPLLSPIPKPFFQTTKESNHVLFITRFSARGKFSLPSSFSLSLSISSVRESEKETARPRARARERARTRKRNR